MSYSVDANLLLYASDRSSPFHQQASSFLLERTKRPEILYLAWPTAMAYLRIATHPRIFASPLAPAEALANLGALLSRPRTRTVSEREGFFGDYSKLTAGIVVRGNLVPDAHLAVILHQHGVQTLFTNDRDFRKFEFLKVENPLV